MDYQKLAQINQNWHKFGTFIVSNSVILCKFVKVSRQ